MNIAAWHRSRTVIVTFFAFACLLALPASQAGAALPGKNGKLLVTLKSHYAADEFSWEAGLSDPSGTDVESVSPPVLPFSYSGAFGRDDRTFAFGSFFPAAISTYRVGDSAVRHIWAMPYDADPEYRLDSWDPISFSPDGKSLMSTHYVNDCVDRDCVDLVSDPSNGIWIFDIAGNSARKIVGNEEIEPEEAIFFPDNRRILISTISGQFVIATTEGRIIRRVTPEGMVGPKDFSISPDGRHVAWSDGETWTNSGQINVLRVSDGRNRTISPLSGDATKPVWSPDGQKIAYTVTTWNDEHDLVTGNDIWIMNSNGTGQTPFISRPGTEIAFDWGRSEPFRIVRYKRSKGLLVVRTWGPGTVSVGGPVFAKRERMAPEAGIVRVPVRVRRGIRLQAGAKFRLNVKFTPRGALPSSLKTYVKPG